MTLTLEPLPHLIPRISDSICRRARPDFFQHFWHAFHRLLAREIVGRRMGDV